MQLTPYSMKMTQPLAEAYVRDFAKVRELYDYNPTDKNSWIQRAADLDQPDRPRADRAEIVEALIRFNRGLGNDGQAIHNVEKLSDERALAVVGGQQAGLFTGPLLVMYKAVTIIRRARQAEQELGRPVVPVFWIAGEDHDFDEVNHIYSLTPGLQVEKIKLEPQAGIRTSMSRLPIDREAWVSAIERLSQSLLQTEFTPDLSGRLNEFAEQSTTLVEFFGRLMSWLFGSHGLVLLDSDDPLLRRAEGPMFRQLIESNSDLNEALLAGRGKLERLGFQPQTDVAKGQANLFVFEQDERLLLHRNGEEFGDKKGQRQYSREKLLVFAENEPQRLSNNVMTRPLMQDFILPVLATVLGPGEIAYWGLTGEAFHHFGMKMPIIIPRLEFTLVEGTLQKHMTKYELSLDDVFNRYEEKKRTWLEQQDTLGLEERFAEVKRQFESGYRPLLESIAELNPGMKKLGDTNLQKIIEQIDFMQARSTDAFQSRFDAALRQMERIKLSLFPLDKPQERVFNVMAYLNKYGVDWLRELVEAPEQLTGEHYICYF